MKETGRIVLTWAALTCCAGAIAAGSDEQWEISTKMDMPGMAMPAVTHTACLPSGGAYKPEKGPEDKHCTVSDLSVSGNRTTWKMHCSGREEMSGSGDVTRTATTLNGTIKISGQGMQMTQAITGHRTGNCDAGAERQQLEAKMQGMRQQGCDASVDADARSGGFEAKMPASYSRQDQCAGSKAALCAKARSYVASYEGYAAYAHGHGWVAAACGITLEAQRTALCSRAQSESKFDFMKRSCPAETRTLVARNCQGFGRGYTADAANPNAGLCRALQSGASGGEELTPQDDVSPAARAGRMERMRKGHRGVPPPDDDGMQQGGLPANGPPGDDSDNAALDATKKLKGMFHF